MRRLVKI
jgi:hypothetical protein